MCNGSTRSHGASLLAAQRKDLGSVATVKFTFGAGTTLPMLLVALLTRQGLLRWRERMLNAGICIPRRAYSRPMVSSWSVREVCRKPRI